MERLFLLVTRIFLLLMAGAFPLWCGFDGYQAITAAKLVAFRLLCGGYAGLMALLWAEGLLVGALRPPKPGELRAALTPLRLAAAAYLAVTWASALLSPRFPETVWGVSRWEGAATISLYCVCFLLAARWGRPDPWLVGCLGGAAAVFCAIALRQLAGGNPLGLYPEGYGFYDAYTAYGGEFLGTLGNTDLCAAYLCVVVPVCWITLLRGRGRARFLLLVPLGLSLAVLLRMGVRAGLVGVAAGGLLCLPAVLPVKKGVRLRLLGLLCLAGAAALALLFFYDPGGGTLHELHALLRGEAAGDFGSGRIYIWRAVLERVPERPLLGFGPDTMAYAAIPPFQRRDEALGGVLVAAIDVAHNEYLNVLYHQGLLGLAAYLAILGLGLAAWVRAAPEDGAAAAAGGGALCYAVQALFGFSMCITAPFFWLALALAGGGAGKIKKEE